MNVSCAARGVNKVGQHWSTRPRSRNSNAIKRWIGYSKQTHGWRSRQTREDRRTTSETEKHKDGWSDRVDRSTNGGRDRSTDRKTVVVRDKQGTRDGTRQTGRDKQWETERDRRGETDEERQTGRDSLARSCSVGSSSIILSVGWSVNLRQLASYFRRRWCKRNVPSIVNVFLQAICVWPTADRSHNISRNIGGPALAWWLDGCSPSVDMAHLIGSNVMPGTNGKRRQEDTETNNEWQRKGIALGH